MKDLIMVGIAGVLLYNAISFQTDIASKIIVILSVLLIIYRFYIRSEFYKNDSPNRKVRKGIKGENQVESIVSLMSFDKKILRNVILHDQHDAEIDLIVLSKYGIFVIECKNFSGWIFGTENRQQWTQTFKTGKKSNFYNPILQNNTHIKALKNTLSGFENLRYVSFVVFSNSSILKFDEIFRELLIVTQARNLKIRIQSVIEKIEGSNKCVELDEWTIEQIAQKLSNTESGMDYGEELTQESRKNIFTLKENKQLTSKYGKCIICNSDIIETSENGGKYLTCENHPSCKFRVRLENFNNPGFLYNPSKFYE